MPIRLFTNRKIAEAVARMPGGTMCWMADSTGPSQTSPSAVGTRNSTNDTASELEVTAPT